MNQRPSRSADILDCRVPQTAYRLRLHELRSGSGAPPLLPPDWLHSCGIGASLFSTSPTVGSRAPSTARCLSNGTGNDPRNDLGLAGARPSVGRLGSLADVAGIPSVTFEPQVGKKNYYLEGRKTCPISCRHRYARPLNGPDSRPLSDMFPTNRLSGKCQPRIPCTARFWSP